MKSYTIFFSFLHFVFVLKGQKSAIELTTSSNKDRSIDILYEGNFRGSYYIKLHFSRLENAVYSDFGHVLNGFRGRVTKLRPLDENRGISFNYSYQFWRGKPIKDYNLNQPYLLPYSLGKNVMVRHITHINQTLGLSVPPNWLSYGFTTENPDSIFACRKGIVVDVVNEYQTDTSAIYKFQSKKNYINVEHDDGTLARYLGFELDKVHVKVGDKVFPGTFLGIVGRYDKTPNMYILHLSFYYLDISKKTMNRGDDGSYGIFYNYLTPLFLTKTGVLPLIENEIYQVVQNDDVIKSEMSKKEKKSYDKSKSLKP